MKLILGSGIVGLMARHILGDDWTVIPFGKSRFYSFVPPLDDNFIIHDPQLDPLMSELGYRTTPVWLQRAFSIAGELVRTDPGGILALDWLHKLFGSNYPAHAPSYLASRMGFFVYNQVRTTDLYGTLTQRYRPALLAEQAKGVPQKIGDHFIIRNGVKTEFERVVSTIPLTHLVDLMGGTHTLKSKTSHHIHMQTGSLNFEGASQVLVVDHGLAFYKATILAPDRYSFCLHQDVSNPGAYFMPIIKDYELLEGTQIADSILLGNMPSLDFLDGSDIFPVGSYAQHDWCADVGSNFLRLLKYAGRGEKAATPKIILPGRGPLPDGGGNRSKQG